MKTTITLNGITKEIELTSEQSKMFEPEEKGWEGLNPGQKFFLSK